MALAKSTYTQTGGNANGLTYFQDAEVTPATLADGTLRQRFDVAAFPQKGVKYAGTNGDGTAVPAAAVTVYP